MASPVNKHAKKNILSRCVKLGICSIVILGIVASIGGCGGKKRVPPPQILFAVKSNDNTNDGRLFYIAIRSVNANQFLIESYQDAASMIFTDPQNTSVLATRAILPGEKKEIKVLKPDQHDVGVYCFFTNPGDPWKILLEQPLSEKYKIALDNNRIVQSDKSIKTKKKKSFFGKLWPF